MWKKIVNLIRIKNIVVPNNDKFYVNLVHSYFNLFTFFSAPTALSRVLLTTLIKDILILLRTYLSSDKKFNLGIKDKCISLSHINKFVWKLVFWKLEKSIQYFWDFIQYTVRKWIHILFPLTKFHKNRDFVLIFSVIQTIKFKELYYNKAA